MLVIELGVAARVVSVPLAAQWVDGVLCVRGAPCPGLIVDAVTRCVYSVGPLVLGEWRRIDKVFSW